MQQTAIMGFGNPCRSDDAVGIYVIEALQKRLADRADVSVFDMGTGAFEVLYKLKGHSRIIIVDGVINSGEPVGSLFAVPAEEVRSAPVDDPMVFLHSIKWDQALSYAKKILQQEYPDDIMVYLIAIDDTRLEMQLSEPVKQAGDLLIETIVNLLHKTE
ncbi:MAG: hydrogenase maturation protease [Bacteroidetes bacterium]|nr:MAG: hydrogenase maturation protease [Bacteroidota bacterium]